MIKFLFCVQSVSELQILVLLEKIITSQYLLSKIAPGKLKTKVVCYCRPGKKKIERNVKIKCRRK